MMLPFPLFTWADFLFVFHFPTVGIPVVSFASLPATFFLSEFTKTERGDGSPGNRYVYKKKKKSSILGPDDNGTNENHMFITAG